MDPDKLYTEVHPDYFDIQLTDLRWYRRLWAVLLRQLEKRTPAGAGLCEWGSGPGHLLRQASERGWKAYGVEPSKVAREYARGLGCEVRHDCHPHVTAAAIATEVLEHVDDPVSELRRWGKHLIPGGHIAISVPNDNNPLQRLFWGRKKPWIHHTHKHYFNMSELCRVLYLAGYKVVWKRTSFPVEILLAIPFMPRKWAWKLSRVWPAPPLLWRLNIGRHLLVVAERTA